MGQKVQFIQFSVFAFAGLVLFGASGFAWFSFYGRIWKRRTASEAVVLPASHDDMVWQGLAFGPRSKVPGDFPAVVALFALIAVILASVFTVSGQDERLVVLWMVVGTAALVGTQVLVVRRFTRTRHEPREVVVDGDGVVHIAAGRRREPVRASPPIDVLFRDADGAYALVVGDASRRSKEVLRLTVGTVLDVGAVRRRLARRGIVVEVGVVPADGFGSPAEASSRLDP